MPAYYNISKKPAKHAAVEICGEFGVPVSLASVALIFLPIGIFHFLSVDLLKMFRDIFLTPSATVGQFPTLTVIIGVVAILLLFIDNRLRKFFLH